MPPRGLRGRTIPSGGIENRFKSLPKPTVTDQNDLQMVLFLREQSLAKRTEAISEFDQLLRQGLVDEAARLDMVARTTD
jgi:hypothetical protein